MKQPGAPKKFAIIDGKSVFYRGYYAMPNLSTKDGTPTGGVYGFAVMALEVIRRLKPDYVCVAWDKPKTNIRKRLEMYPQYKAGRKPAPADFYEQIPVLHELLDAFGWPLYELDDYEADDIMGALAVQAREKKLDTMLITSDLDALQLINGNVHVYALKKGLSNIELFHPESFEAKYGLKPDQFLDLKSLKGDSSDNIPGVPGVGEKTAIELLKQFKSLEGVYDNLDLIKETTRKKLEAGKDLAYLSKKLGAIWIDAPIKLNLKELDVSKCDPVRIQEVLHKLEFRTLARQLPEVMNVPNNLPSSVKPTSQSVVGKSVHINKPDLLKSIPIKNAKQLYVHSFCAGKHGHDPQLLILSEDGKTTYTINLAAIDRTKAASALKTIILPETELIGYDVKSTLKVLIGLDLPLPKVGHDVQVGAFLLNPLRRDQSLTALATEDLHYDGHGFQDLDSEQLTGIAAEIITVIRGLAELQSEQMSELTGIIKVAQNIEWPVIPVLAQMEYEGIRLDSGYLEVMGVELADEISDVEQQIYGHADQEFNISSPHQLAEILYEKLNLPKVGVKKGKTGYSTAATELDKLRGTHPIIDLITQYRELTKLKNTYVDTLPKMVDENSRLHTTYALTVAQTGRLSSNDPNLQNIPVRTDLGRRIRTAFVASPGNMLVSADYSQFELRLAAYLANDEELTQMFNDGHDIHTITASQVYGRDPEDVTKQMRRDAKVINFGVLYGMSPHGLSVATGMTVAAAKAFIDKYFELRKPLLDYINTLKDKARKDGYVETLFGRRRPTPDVHSSNFVVRQAAERAAINMPIQGTEADLMKMAMIEVQKKLEGTECKLLLQIHDSLIVECPQDEVEQTTKLLKETMENIYKLPVRLDVDTSVGRNWGEL